MQNEYLANNKIELVGSLGSPLYLYLGDDQYSECGLFTIIVDPTNNDDLCLNSKRIVVPVHLWSKKPITALRELILIGKVVSIHGSISMFGDRALVVVQDANDITFLDDSYIKTKSFSHNDNCYTRHVSYAAAAEDMFMARLAAAAEAAENSEGRVWVCEK